MFSVLIVERVAHNEFLQFLEQFFSPDGKITSSGTFTFYIRIYTPFIFLGVFWIFINYIEFKNFCSAIKHINILQANFHIKISCILSVLLIILWLFLRRSRFSFLYYEGFFEWLTACCLFLASAILITSNNKKRLPNNLRFYLHLISAVLLILGMEEISWGQTIFNWNTPNFLRGMNIQNETNLHNLFNPLFHLIYALLSLALGLILLFSDEVKKTLGSTKFFEDIVLFLPSANFGFFGLLFLMLSFVNGMTAYGLELTEEIFSVFSVAYAIELNKSFSTKYTH